MDYNLLHSQNSSARLRSSIIGATALNPDIRIFDFGNVIVQKDYTNSENSEYVRIISGGPYYIGDHVGKGMLTAAIQGDNLTAPASSVILRTLRELSYNHLMGILVIVPTSSGCTLNFGLAIERALNDDLAVKMLTVSDDFLNVQQRKMSRRTLSGIVLLYKIAGAMAVAKKSLAEIYDYCQNICKNMRSMEIPLPRPNVTPNTTCICVDDVFGKVSNKSMGEQSHTIKVPLGNLITIFEASSNFRIDVRSIDGSDKLKLSHGEHLVILLNNNTFITKTEEYVCVKDVLEYLDALNITVVRFFTGNYIKCSDQPLLTITLLKVDDLNILTYLDSHYGHITGWPQINQIGNTHLSTHTTLAGNLRRKERLIAPIKGPKLSERATNTLNFAMQFACDALISCERQLNVIDLERDDGDTGTRLKSVAELLLKRMQQNKVIMNYPFTFFESMSKFLEKSLGGTSGCIYSILFEAAAQKFAEFNDTSEVTPYMWLESFKAAGEALKQYGNVDFGEGTLYDPICAFCQTAEEELTNCEHVIIAFGNAISKCEEAIENTKRNRKYPDPGAHAVGIWIRAIFEGVKLRWPVDAVCLS